MKRRESVPELPAGLISALWDVLACPCEKHAAVEADEEASEIVCSECSRRFPVRDGIPVMLMDQAGGDLHESGSTSA